MSDMMIPDEFDSFGWPAGIASGLVWFLGPAANAVRKNLAIWSDYQSANILKLAEKIHARQSDQPGQVHPKVAAQILAEASWTEDDVAHEYFAGMLIGARSPDGEEGDNAYFARLASNLSVDQLRLHHMIYASVAGLGPGNELRTREGASRIHAFMHEDEFKGRVARARIGTAAAVLEREDLLGEYCWDPEATPLLMDWFPQATGPGFAFRPTSLGAQLFLKAYGLDVPDTNVLLGLDPLPSVQSDMPRATSVVYGPGVHRLAAS